MSERYHNILCKIRRLMIFEMQLILCAQETFNNMCFYECQHLKLPMQKTVCCKSFLLVVTMFNSVQLSYFTRLWYFSSSVNSFFKRACAAIQWGWMSDFWTDTSSTSILSVCEQRRLWRDCANEQARLSLHWSPM